MAKRSRSLTLNEVCTGSKLTNVVSTPDAGALADTLKNTAANTSEVTDTTRNFSHLSVLPFATLLENVAGVYVSLYMGRTLVTGCFNCS